MSAKVPEVTHTLSFYPTCWKLSLIFALWAAAKRGHWPRFHIHSLSTPPPSGYGPLFKVAIFGHELCHRNKFKKLHIQCLYTQGVEIELIFALRAAVFEIQANFPNCHTWAWNLVTDKRFRSSTYTLFLLQGFETELNFALQAAVSEIRANFPNCHIWAWNLLTDKRFRSCIYTLFLPQVVEIELIFALRAVVFRDTGHFSKLPYLGMKCSKWAKFQKLHTYSLSTPGGQKRLVNCPSRPSARQMPMTFDLDQWKQDKRRMKRMRKINN